MIPGTTPIVKALLYINVFIYLLSSLFPSFMYGNFVLNHILSEDFRIWQPLTHMFMHGGLIHLVFNMASLYFAGPFCENYLGTNRFLILYFASGFLACMVSMLFLFGPMLGASGAICGLVLFWLILNQDSKFLLFFVLPMKGRYIILIFFLMEGFLGIRSLIHPDGVAHFAHLGGAIFGCIMVALNKMYDKQ